MKGLQRARAAMGISQRDLAAKARIAYKSVQLIESGRHNASCETLARLAAALGFGTRDFFAYLDAYFATPPDSIVAITRAIVSDGESSWKTHLFNFVDAYRRSSDGGLIAAPPHGTASPRIAALCASVVETLCDQIFVPHPWWCAGIAGLPHPWFVADMENLKAISLCESPMHFRKRNLFVLSSILERA